MKIKKLLIFLLIFLSPVIIARILLQIIPFKEFDEFCKKPYSLNLLDRNNNLLKIIPLDNGLRREYTLFDDIPAFVKKIFIASEDKRYYLHYGFDIIAIARSIIINIKNKYPVSGASTITMQLSRIIAPHNIGYKGKIIEIINAIRLEAKLTKKQILENWLNSIPFGKLAVGIESASKTYFGKSINELSPAQILVLAVIPRRPITYDPFQNKYLVKTACLELAKRIDYKISDQEIDEALSSVSNYNYITKAVHFTNYINPLITQDEYAKGIPVKTSIDLNLNCFIEERLKYYTDVYKNCRLDNGASLVIDNHTGEIIAYVGSQDFDDKTNNGEIDGVHVLNQPGSALKPFLYALALDNGFLPSDILPDIPLEFGHENIYTPSNYNLRFNGPVRLRVALASSLNIPAVYLVTKIGVKNFINKLIDLDFISIGKQQYNLGSGIAIGNAEVSLFEIVRAFSVFPRHGKKLQLKFRASDNKNMTEGERVYSEYTAGIICNILSDNASRSLAFGRHTKLNTAFTAMFKTGTSNQFGNIWAIGAIPDYTVGVWLGNFKGDTVIGKTGSSLPAIIAVQILEKLVKQPKDFYMPRDVKKIIICPLSGKKVTEACQGAVYEYYPLKAKIENCDYHYSENGKNRIKYPPMFASWMQKYSNKEIITSKDENMTFPKIIKPQDEAIYYFDPTIKSEEQVVKIEVLNNIQNNPIAIYINEKFIVNLKFPYVMHFPMQIGEWEIKAESLGKIDKIKFSVK